MDLLNTNSSIRKDYFNYLYKKSFPKEERIEIDTLFALDDDGLIDINILSNNNKPIGLAVIYLSQDIHLLSYFAIDPSLRNMGYGARGLDLLKSIYDELMVEIESTDDRHVDDYLMRNRRKAFYIRNGYKILDQRVDYFGTKMELMATSKEAGLEDYFKIYNGLFDQKYVDRNIKIVKEK